MTFTAKEEMLTLAKRLILTEIVCEIKENRYLKPSLTSLSQNDIASTAETSFKTNNTACVQLTTTNGEKQKITDSSVTNNPVEPTGSCCE